MKISIAIPIYNEESNIPLLYNNVCRIATDLHCDLEIVFVNDGSQDGSAEKLDELAAIDRNVKVIHLRRNYGQTAALMAAIDSSEGDIIVTMDGDLQNDPADIPRLLIELDKGYDVVSGWRQIRKEPWLTRRLPSRVANALLSRLTGLKLHDYGCTLKAYRRDVIKGIRLYGEMHRFIPLFAMWEGARVGEIPVQDRPRRHGVSKYGVSRVPRVFLDMILVYFLHKALDRPMQFFGRVGIYSFLLAVAVGLFAIYLRVFEGISFILTPLPLFVVMLGICSLLCVLLGLVGEMLTRIYYEGRDARSYVIRDARSSSAIPHLRPDEKRFAEPQV